MARLVLLSEGLTGRTFELKSEKTTVGRVSDNMFEIPEASISSHHAEVLLRGNEVHVRDLNSTNGTFINGEKITESLLKPGQILRLGMVEMRLETVDTAAAVAATKKAQTLDQTRVIPQGVKLDELEGARAPLDFGKSGFEKKSDKGTRTFVSIVVIVGAILVCALVWVLIRAQSQ
jgi:pSer/pThr/pTyr-binding forkhead associated (FHA) protein